MSGAARSRSSLSATSRLSFGGPVRLNDLLEDNDDDEYGFIGADVERALDVRDASEEDILRVEHVVKGISVETKLPDVHVIPAGGEGLTTMTNTSAGLSMAPTVSTTSLASSTGHGSDGEATACDKASMGSNDSGKHEQSKISAFLDKAKSKGRKIVGGSKKKPEVADESAQCVLIKPNEATLEQPTTSSARMSESMSIGENIGTSQRKTPNSEEQPASQFKKKVYLDPADPTDPFHVQSLVHKCRVLPFFRSRMLVLGLLIAFTISFPGFFTGLMWGLYISIIGFLYFFVSEPKPKDEMENEENYVDDEIDIATVTSSMATGDEGQGFGIADGVVYQGWMNELRARYSPANYHVNSAQSVLVRLEGSMLRICRPAKAVLKHAFYNDPTLKQATPTMVSQTIYDLQDAQVSLRPKRLARRRWWSRKYPIFIRFAHSSSTLADVDHTRIGKNGSRTSSLRQSPLSVSVDLCDLPMSASEPIGDCDDGYSAESDVTSDEEELSLGLKLPRSNSTGDMSEFSQKSRGARNKERGRTIFLFVRAAREKERWFHLLREAVAKSRSSKRLQRCTSEMPKSPSSASLVVDDVKTREAASEERMSVAIEATMLDDEKGLEKDTLFDTPKRKKLPAKYEYIKYRGNYASFVREISSILSVAPPSRPDRKSTVSVDLGTMKWHAGATHVSQELVDSINVLTTRIFFDFCRDEFWIRQVKQKIQSKLATIHLPYFIEKLELGELKFGTQTPRIVAVYSPKVDEWGTWVDFDIKYNGGIRLVLQTSVNLLKLQSGAQQVETEKKVTRWTDSIRVTRYSDSDLPESPESSPDEDFGAKNHSDGTTKERTGKKILSIVERAAQSALFQKAAKLPSLAKLIEDVSTTPLMLNVEVEEVDGTMTINIPPPPSDRLWYAFRRRPVFRLKAVPQVGDRSVDLSTVSEWIEAKLRLLLEKNLVCPNMDDIILPVLSGNDLLHMGYNR